MSGARECKVKIQSLPIKCFLFSRKAKRLQKKASLGYNIAVTAGHNMHVDLEKGLLLFKKR